MAHRDAQARLAATTVRQMLDLWPLLDLDDLDGSFLRWARAARRVIDAQHDRSSRLAAAYYRALRPASPVRFAPLLADRLDPDAVTHALLVNGPVKVKQIIGSGRSVDKAAEVAVSLSSGVAARLAAKGGRDTVTVSALRDPVARGWARVGAGGCDFCAMLIARGPVYSESTADFAAHTGCRCTAEPVFGDRYEGQAHAEALAARLAAAH